MIKQSIRSTIEQYMLDHHINLSAFAKLSGVNRGMISKMLNGNPPESCSVTQLDLLTQAMDLQEGELYPLYVNESMSEQLHWRRAKPFLLRCAELHRLDCLEQMVELISETQKHVSWLFTTAEELFALQYMDAAAILYEATVEIDQTKFSERLIMSYYRLFKIYNSDPKRGFEAALQFIPYRIHLPEHYALDGLIMLADTYAIREDWEKVEKYADELRKLAKGIYRTKGWQSESFKPLRPLVYYYAQGHLYKAMSYEHRQMFDDFRKWIDGYADLSWFEGLDEVGKRDVENFKMFAQGNYLLCDIKAGNPKAIKDYLDFMSTHPSEVLEGLITIIGSANKYKFLIDKELNLFASHIKDFEKISTSSIEEDIAYKESFQTYRYSIFFKKYAIYLLRNKRYNEGITNILQSLKISVKISHNDSLINSTMSLFEMNRDNSSDLQKAIYSDICREVWSNEKEDYFVFQ